MLKYDQNYLLQETLSNLKERRIYMTIDIRTNVSHYIYSQQFSQLIPRCLTSLTFYMLYNPYFICICYVLRPAFDNRVSDIGQIISY